MFKRHFSPRLCKFETDKWFCRRMMSIPGSGMWVCWDWGLLLHTAKLSTAQASIKYIKPLPCSTASLTKLEWSWPREGWLHLLAGLLRPAVCPLSGACTGWHSWKLPSKDSCASNKICLFPMHSEWKFILIVLQQGGYMSGYLTGCRAHNLLYIHWNMI